MSQDVVTATDAAAPSVGTVQLPDARLICEKLDEALAREGFNRAVYSEPVKYLFQQAWAVASHKQSTQVTIHHLAYALVFNYPEPGTVLAEHLDSDVDSFAVGCILKILALGVSTGDLDVRPPAVGTVRWVGKAAGFARKRSGHGELLPEDLVEAILRGCLPAPDHGLIKSAARVGNARHAVVISREKAPSITDASDSSRDIIMHMEEVERGQPSDSVVLAKLLTRLEDVDDRHSAEFASQQETLSRIESMITNRPADIGDYAKPNLDWMARLESIDERVSALHEVMPHPPSLARVAAAIVAVLTLGIGAGLTLSPEGSEITQLVSVLVKSTFADLAH